MKKIRIKLIDGHLGKEFLLPNYTTAGLDLYAYIDEVSTINHGETILTSVSFYAVLLLLRSSLGHKHVIVLGNLTSLINADYQGDFFVSCWNRNDASWTINSGNRYSADGGFILSYKQTSSLLIYLRRQ